MLLRAGQTADLHAKVLFRPTGSNTALVSILGQVFTIDYVRRLVDAGVAVDASERKVRWSGVKTQGDVSKLFASYPKLGIEDFKMGRLRASLEEPGKLAEPVLKDGKVYSAGRAMKVKENELGTKSVIDEETGVKVD